MAHYNHWAALVACVLPFVGCARSAPIGSVASGSASTPISTASPAPAANPGVARGGPPGRGWGGGPRGPGRGAGVPMGSATPLCAACPVASASAMPAFTPAVRAAVDRALEAERGAEARYRNVTAKLGDRPPFSRIANAEARHAWLLENLYLARGLALPKNDVKAAELPAGASLADACAAALVAEKKVVAMYDELLAITDLPDDVRNAFAHLREISRDRHLPVFQACR